MQQPDRPPAGNTGAISPTAAGSAPPGTVFRGAPVEIRALRTPAEYRACVLLQLETWGDPYSELVPASILKVVQRVGGCAVGAFDPDGALLGFVFGISGFEPGTDGALRPVHWSDMLAVRRDARDRGIGQRLKQHQRETLRMMGVERMYWTFDPLVARNAQLNLTKLGVQVAEYAVDMYDPTNEADELYGTDRFVVSWQIAGDRATSQHMREDRLEATMVDDMPIVNAGAEGGDETARLVRVEIPLDIAAIRDSAPETAARWRSSTRDAFTRLLARQYTITGFVRDQAAGRGYYLLSR
jgi:predicted GNAT superfamily acetyltransferase